MEVSTQFAKKFSLLTLLVVASCSHHKKTSAPNASGADTTAATSDESGVVNFFDTPGVERGVVIKNIHWGDPVTSENPGADCELKNKTMNGYSNFICVVKQGTESVVVTMREESAGDQRRLSRITIDGKTPATRDRWIKLIQDFGYGKISDAGTQVNRSRWTSPDQKTELQMVWAGPKDAITMIFSPAHKGKLKAAVKKTK